MASPSSLMSRNYTYNVFASFRGPDVRKTLLSHLREQFNRYGITMFNDEEIVRGATISPSLKDAIKESRISLVILSKKYASSGWCLDELVEILNCKEVMGQIVMTIFYDGVEPSHVRNQTGEFGIAFNKTCELKTDEERQKWSKALTDVANIEGEDFLRWNNEAKMIEKIARDISDKLNATPSRDFDGMVGIGVHLREVQSLLDLDYDGVKMVAISGPAGIGKSTIARALHCLLSDRFQLTCFVDNLRDIYPIGLDEHGLKLRLQNQLLTKLWNQNSIRTSHLGVIKERLGDRRVLIILDDVNNINQLEALAKETTWFGSGSRILVTTENKELLQQHGINNMYHVGFPSDYEAFRILCGYAFGQSYPHDGFKEIAKRVTTLCGNLPLGLRVVGSTLCGKKKDEWEDVINNLENTFDRDIDNLLRIGYEGLNENEQTLFLHIAIFFNYKNDDLVKTMFVDGDLDVKRGLKILVDRSLIEISTYGKKIMMHKLLQQMARKAIRKQEPWKRQILTDAQDICDVLENKTGTSVVSGISFDISGIDEISISKKAFKRMSKLRFLSVYKSKDDGNDIMHIPEGMEFPRRLRLLHWNEYPNKCLPPKFHSEYLVELNMQGSQLEYLWHGNQKLTHLKVMDLYESYHLKELPDLSSAINLEILSLSFCTSLVEIPSSCSHLHKLQKVWMTGCTNLEVIPAHMNLSSLVSVSMEGCPRLRNFPALSTHIKEMYISHAEVEDVSASISICSRLERLSINNNGKLKGLTHLPMSLISLNLTNCGIERIPDCIKALCVLQTLFLSGCRRLVSLPELPRSLRHLYAEDCESLEKVFYPLNTRNAVLRFTNCCKLDKQSQRAIIQQAVIHGGACLPGREVPTEFNHRAKGNSVTIRFDGNRVVSSFTNFQVCLVVSPIKQTKEYRGLVLCRIVKDDLDTIDEMPPIHISLPRTEHLLTFHSYFSNWREEFESLVMSSEVMFEFSSEFHDFDVIECGVQILEERYESESDQVFEDQVSEPSEPFEDQLSESGNQMMTRAMGWNPANSL